MARTSAILVVAFVLAVVLSIGVQADSQCMSKCNSKCLAQKKKSTSVSCGVGCFVKCVDYENQKLSPELKAKVVALKKKAMDGSIDSKDVQTELFDIAKHMMVVSSTKVHDHDHSKGEKPKAAPVDWKVQEKDITDDDDDETDE